MQIKNWDGKSIYQLRDLVREMRTNDDTRVDMTALPHADQIPDLLQPYTSYPIWACDINGNCLVGDDADSIEHAEEILDYLDLNKKN